MELNKVKKASELRSLDELNLEKFDRMEIEKRLESLEEIVFYGRAIAFASSFRQYCRDYDLYACLIKLASALDEAGFIYHFDVETLSAVCLYNEVCRLWTPFGELPFFYNHCEPQTVHSYPWEEYNRCYEENPWVLNTARKMALLNVINDCFDERGKTVIGLRYGLFGFEKLPFTHESFGPGIRSFKELNEKTGMRTDSLRGIESKGLRKLRFGENRDRLDGIFRQDASLERFDELIEELNQIRKNPIYVRARELEKEVEYYSEGHDKVAERAKVFLNPNYRPESIEDDTIRALGLSARALNCLANANIKTVGSLLAQCDDGLLEIRGLGEKTREEILSKLKDLWLI